MSRDEMPKKVVAVAGIVGTEPEVRETDYGDVLNFRLAVNVSYDDDAESKWFDVAVWNEGLIKSCEAELFKGAKVAVEGTFKVDSYDGKDYPKISAAKVGLVEWLQRSKNTGSTTRRRSRDEEEEERPARRTSSRSSSGSRSTGRTSSRTAEKDDTEGDELPW